MKISVRNVKNLCSQKAISCVIVSYGSYLGRDQRMTPPESPREVREVREAGLLQTLDQNREQGQRPPEMEFLDIILTNDSSLLFRAIHSPFYPRILQKSHTQLWV